MNDGGNKKMGVLVCCVCRREVDNGGYDDYICRHGRIYRFCRIHALILDVVTWAADEYQRGSKEDIVPNKKGGE